MKRVQTRIVAKDRTGKYHRGSGGQQHCRFVFQEEFDPDFQPRAPRLIWCSVAFFTPVSKAHHPIPPPADSGYRVIPFRSDNDVNS